MSQENVKRQILSEDPVKESTFPLIHRISFNQMFRLGSPANYTPSPTSRLKVWRKMLVYLPKKWRMIFYWKIEGGHSFILL